MASFDKAVKGNPDAHSIFRSDCSFPYTSRTFQQKPEKAGMTQSMSRVAKYINDGPIEGFCDILKRERYCGRRFTSKQELARLSTNYIGYYNNGRVQRNLAVTVYLVNSLCATVSPMDILALWGTGFDPTYYLMPFLIKLSLAEIQMN